MSKLKIRLCLYHSYKIPLANLNVIWEVGKYHILLTFLVLATSFYLAPIKKILPLGYQSEAWFVVVGLIMLILGGYGVGFHSLVFRASARKGVKRFGHGHVVFGGVAGSFALLISYAVAEGGFVWDLKFTSLFIIMVMGGSFFTPYIAAILDKPSVYYDGERFIQDKIWKAMEGNRFGIVFVTSLIILSYYYVQGWLMVFLFENNNIVTLVMISIISTFWLFYCLTAWLCSQILIWRGLNVSLPEFFEEMGY